MAKKTTQNERKIHNPRKMRTFTGKKYATRKKYRGQGR